MSHVDNWLLLPVFMEDNDAILAVNQKLLELDPIRKQRFRKLDGHSWGGSKFPETPVYGLACNYIPPDLVREAIRAAPWKRPEDALVMLKGQNDNAWTVWHLSDPEL